MEEQETLRLNPHEDRIIGVVGSYIFLKPEYEKYVLMVKERDYIRALKGYLKSKKDFCERYNHFCGVFGEFYIEKYEKVKDIILNEYFDVEDNNINDGIEMREVPYPLYKVIELDKHCDMEHG